MPVLSIRYNEAARRYLLEQAAGVPLSEYARERLGIAQFHERPASDSRRLLLHLTDRQKAALLSAASHNGFANPSAYVRARLFLSPPPPAPEPENSSDTMTSIRLVLRGNDRRRIAEAARATRFEDPAQYVLDKIFEDEG